MEARHVLARCHVSNVPFHGVVLIVLLVIRSQLLMPLCVFSTLALFLFMHADMTSLPLLTAGNYKANKWETETEVSIPQSSDTAPWNHTKFVPNICPTILQS